MKFFLLFLSSVVSATATFDVQVGYQGRLEFFPNQLTVAPGDTVRFRFMAGTHTVTMEQSGAQCQKAASALFDYRQQVGSTAEFVFHDAGTFGYYCAIGDHCQKGMRGSVTVSASGDGSGGAGSPGAAAPNANAPVSTSATNGTAPTNGTATTPPATTPPATTTIPATGTTTNGTNSTNSTNGSSGNYESNGVHWLMTFGAVAMTMGWLNA